MNIITNLVLAKNRADVLLWRLESRGDESDETDLKVARELNQMLGELLDEYDRRAFPERPRK